MRVLDIAFYSEQEAATAAEILKRHKGSWEHYPLMTEGNAIVLLKFGRFDEDQQVSGIDVKFRKALSSIGRLRALFLVLRKTKPDLIVTHSFHFPLQTLIMKMMIKPSTKLVVQDHADVLSKYRFFKKLQSLVYFSADAFLFVSKEQAKPFISNSIVKSEKVFEIMEGSATFRTEAKSNVQDNEINLIWVGRLIARKDPMTVLRAFAKAAALGMKFNLQMIYNDSLLLPELSQFIKTNNLSSSVKLYENVASEKMIEFYSKAHYFVSASSFEGSGWSLCEAMACHCVPILSNIPSHHKMCAVPELSLFFECGDYTKLADILLNLDHDQYPANSKLVFNYFLDHLSHEAIARDTLKLIKTLHINQ